MGLDQKCRWNNYDSKNSIGRRISVDINHCEEYYSLGKTITFMLYEEQQVGCVVGSGLMLHVQYFVLLLGNSMLCKPWSFKRS